jgi:hypothetical protein
VLQLRIFPRIFFQDEKKKLFVFVDQSLFLKKKGMPMPQCLANGAARLSLTMCYHVLIAFSLYQDGFRKS